MDTPPLKEPGPSRSAPPSKRDLQALKHDHRDLIRVLILDPWFRLAVVVVVLAFLTTVIALPKFWRTTPPAFNPQVRVSLLNLGQAWQLRRSARALEAEGRTEEATAAWHAAFMKNAGDVVTARKALRMTVESTNLSTKAIGRLAAVPSWLLSLSATNHDDVLLVARYLDKVGLPGEVYGLLEPLKNDLSDAEEIVFLKSLVERGDEQQYAARWKRLEGELAKDPEFALYHQAYLAAWGPVAERDPARRRLAEAAGDPARRVVASRLQLIHLGEGRDAAGYAEALGRLVDQRADRPADHIRYWGLLLSLGRKDEAGALAEQYAVVPPRPQDAAALAEALYALEMKPQAERLLARMSVNYGARAPLWAQMIWVARANLLIKDNNWRGLLDLVDQLRAFPRAVGYLGGWVDAVEGKAHHALRHQELASAAMDTAVRKPFPATQLAYDAAVDMIQLGYSRQATELLRSLEKVLANNVMYWQKVYQLAVAVKEDPLLMLKSATEVRRLNPRDPASDFNYAAALLVNRANPGEAVSLTRQALDREPASAEARVNHCLALTQNQRYGEAATLLATVDPNRFDEFGRTVYSFAAFTVHLGLKQHSLARLDLEKIQPKHLFHPEVLWLDQMRRERLGPTAPTNL